MERQVGFAPTALGFCRPFLWTTQALTHVEIFYRRVIDFATLKVVLEGFEPSPRRRLPAYTV